MAFRSDRSPAACTFYQKVLLNNELTNLSLKSGFFSLLDLQFFGALSLALECIAKTLLKLLFPLADLCGSDVVLARDLGCGLHALERFKGYPSFELGRQVSSFSFHSSVVWVAPPTASILHLAFGSVFRGHFTIIRCRETVPQ